DRLDHPVEVAERLPHALEEHAVDPAKTRCPKLGPEDTDLLDDLPGLEVPLEAHPPGGAEGARERAADLGAYACREAPFALQRDAHRLDHGAVAEAEGVLDERVFPARPSLEELERRDVRDGAGGIEGFSP